MKFEWHATMKLKINKEFAEVFNRRKEREELQRLNTKYGDDLKDSASCSSSSSESEDEDGKELTEKRELDFLKILSAVESKDPRIYDPNFKFFDQEFGGDEDEDDDNDDDDDDDDDENEEEYNRKVKTKSKREKKGKPMFLKDYDRKVITDREGKLSDDESQSETEMNQSSMVGYYEQDEINRKRFQDAAAEIIDESDDEDFLKRKVLSNSEKKKKDDDYLEWLKGHNSKIDEALAKDLDPLREMWTNPDLDENEKFLRDFILNKQHKFEIDSDLDEEAALKEADEDEKQFDDEEIFAVKFNFRHEEEDKEFLKSYPRTVGDSMRNKDNQRAEKRKQVKERKLSEKQKEKEELKRLKNLKKKEMLKKLEKLKQITGNDLVNVTEEDLEDDFDPEKHDAVMEKLIGEDYYDQDADDEKPEFSQEDFDDEENWSKWTDGECQDKLEGIEEADEQLQPCHSRHDKHLSELHEKVNKKKSKFAEELERLKQSIDRDKMTPDQYLQEVLYGMDYEDKIGNVTFRFNYRNVVPCDYGLTVDEILNVPDRELNSWISVKKINQYRTEEDEKFDVKLFKKKSRNIKKKLNILPSLREDSLMREKRENIKESQPDDQMQFASHKKRHKKRKNKVTQEEEGSPREKLQRPTLTEKKKRKATSNMLLNNISDTIPVDAFQEKGVELKGKKGKTKNTSVKENGSECKKPRLENAAQSSKNNSKQSDKKISETCATADTSYEKIMDFGNKGKVQGKKKTKKHQHHLPTISSDRLEAYGINEKKFKYVIQNKVHHKIKRAKDQHN